MEKYEEDEYDKLEKKASEKLAESTAFAPLLKDLHAKIKANAPPTLAVDKRKSKKGKGSCSTPPSGTQMR